MRIALGNDHAGFPLKERVRDLLTAAGHDVVDCGTDSDAPVDFPDITEATCAPVLDGTADRALLVCGTGAGAVMAANKIPGIRCGLGNEVYSAHQCVEHDDANALAIGAWLVAPAILPEILDAFLTATFDESPDTVRRVAKLNALDELSVHRDDA